MTPDDKYIYSGSKDCYIIKCMETSTICYICSIQMLNLPGWQLDASYTTGHLVAKLAPRMHNLQSTVTRCNWMVWKLRGCTTGRAESSRLHNRLIWSYPVVQLATWWCDCPWNIELHQITALLVRFPSTGEVELMYASKAFFASSQPSDSLT